MFIMMNELRFQVGLGGVGPALAGYLYSLQYARQRTQGRSPLCRCLLYTSPSPRD